MVTGGYKDAGIQREYTRGVGSVLKQHGYRSGATGIAGMNMTILEGDWLPGNMLFFLAFPSSKDVKSFWWSEQYQKLRRMRASASNLDVVALTGVADAKPLLTKDAAYLVFTADVTDMPRLMKDYGPYAPAVVQEHGGQFLVREGRANMTLLEGEYPPGSVIVVEFSSVATLRAFWNSDDYKKLSEIRKSTGKWSVVEITPRP